MAARGQGYFVASNRVSEGYGLGMEVQSVACSAVEHVANDGTVKSLWMRSVHSQLVGATSKWCELNQGAIATMFQYTVVRYGLFAVLVVDNLSWTVVGIWAQWQVDYTFLLGWAAVEQCKIGFVYFPLLKLLSQSALNVLCLGNHH